MQFFFCKGIKFTVLFKKDFLKRCCQEKSLFFLREFAIFSDLTFVGEETPNLQWLEHLEPYEELEEYEVGLFFFCYHCF